MTELSEYTPGINGPFKISHYSIHWDQPRNDEAIHKVIESHKHFNIKLLSGEYAVTQIVSQSNDDEYFQKLLEEADKPILPDSDEKTPTAWWRRRLFHTSV